MRAKEFITEKRKIKTCNTKAIAKPTQAQCNKPRASLSAARYAQCVSSGLKAHDSQHTLGSGKQGVKGSGVKLKHKKVNGEIYGGPIKSDPHR